MSFNDELAARKQYLSNLMEEEKRKLKKAPKGTLRLSGSQGTYQFYHRADPSDRNGTYIPKKNIKLITGLAQKGYDKKVIKAAVQEIKAIDAYLDLCPKEKLEDLYENTKEVRRKLIIPIRESDEMFRKRWESIEYCGNSFEFNSSGYLTGKGEQVRSKSEIIIADMLAKEDVPYRYEYPLYLEGADTIYPDFMVLNVRLRKELYWEHFGIMDDAEYAEKAVRKIAKYYMNGFYPGENLILTYETRATPLNVLQIKEIIKHYLL